MVEGSANMEEAFVQYIVLQLGYVGRILLAGICGYVIGLERQTKRKMAGPKTHVIVAITAALMIVLSKYGFDDVLGEYIKLDPSRVAAGIVTAIGFLGSGMILSKNNNIIGLTTSAGIWATVGVGMAMGAGLYLIGILTTVMVIFSELFLGRKSNVTENVEVERDIEIEYIEEAESEINVSAILQSGFHENGFQVEKVQIKRQDTGITKIIISVCSDEKTNPFFLTELMDRYKEIIKVSL